MSQDKSQTPKTANPNSFVNKPQRGNLFVRTSGGSVLLTQTLKLFGASKKDRG